ncbi:MAG: hypothetical protein SVR04_17935, partial [Spirochaetota bacterium]|nr:hypothetical protein [Spirochaetota bacterium]
RKQVNKHLNVFSRVSEFVVEHQPFEKTPTQKIKRYLYTQLGMKNKIEPDDHGEQNDSQAE